MFYILSASKKYDANKLTLANAKRKRERERHQCSRGRTVGRPLRTKIRKVRTFILTQESWDAHIFDLRRQNMRKDAHFVAPERPSLEI